MIVGPYLDRLCGLAMPDYLASFVVASPLGQGRYSLPLIGDILSLFISEIFMPIPFAGQDAICSMFHSMGPVPFVGHNSPFFHLRRRSVEKTLSPLHTGIVVSKFGSKVRFEPELA